MKTSLRKVVAAGVAAGALLFAVPTAANANTYYNVSSGTDIVTSTTTLYYTNPHGNFNLRAWVTTNGWLGVSNRYSIKMYNSSGSLLWSASNQGDRTYTIGGNVTKVVLQRVSVQGATMHWQRS